MTYLVERLAELRKHLDHVAALAPRVTAIALRADLSLHNDVLFSLLTICQLVIDMAGDLSARRGLAFEDDTQAVQNLAVMNLVDAPALADLEKLPGFRNVLVHEYVALDFERVVDAVNHLDAVRQFADALAQTLGGDQ